jgi:beta-N-acetylhexosaminidase
MRTRVSGLVLVLLLAIPLAAASQKREPTAPLRIGSSEEKWAAKMLSRMTVEQKAGQLIGVRYSGRFYNLEDEARKALEDLVVRRHVGGLCLFGGNVYETAFLTNALQAKAEIPLLVASDFERGAGNQIDGSTLFPPLMALGAIGSEDTAYAMGRITALEARAMGVHMTYAPVMDVNINPANPIISTRSAGEDPGEVARLGRAFILGCQDHGLLATAKHFPGHGDTALDSHIQLAVIPGDRERLDKVELYPFRKAVEAGVSAIMIAHLSVPALDPAQNTPATLSPVIVTDLLRREMGFQGLVVTDAMEMGGITTLYPAGEAAVKAVQAGVDIVLLPADVGQAVDGLVQAVRTGLISRSRLDDAVLRILKVKAGLGLAKKKLVDVGSLAALIASKENRAAAQEAFEKAITLVKNEGAALPLEASGQKLALLCLSSDAGDFYVGRPFAQELAKRVKDPKDLTVFYADAFTGQEYIDEAVNQSKSAGTVIVAVFSRLTSSKGTVDLNTRHIQAVKSLAAEGAKVVVVSFGSPYFLQHFPEVTGYLCAYRQPAEAQAAAARALFGEVEVSGKLPVTLPGLFPRGHGLVLPKRGD